MSCEVDKRAGVLHIRGEMTIYGAVALKDELFAVLEGETGACTLDLAQVSEFDTTGLQLLLMAQRVCNAAGRPFALANLSATVRETVGLLQLHNWAVTTPGGAV